MRPRLRPTRRFAAMERRSTCWLSCRPAAICTSTSTITPTRRNWTSYSRTPRKSDGVFEETTMIDAQSPTAAFKPKKSVALSGVTAGNTALCTVGTTGNDLHYRGYDILDIATGCEFEEIAHLLVHEKLPNRAELAAYKTKLRALRVLPAAVSTVLEQLPAESHPMDVLRTGVSALGCCVPEAADHKSARARDIADRLLASLSSMLCYWYHFSRSARRIEVQTDDDSI